MAATTTAAGRKEGTAGGQKNSGEQGTELGGRGGTRGNRAKKEETDE